MAGSSRNPGSYVSDSSDVDSESALSSSKLSLDWSDVFTGGFCLGRFFMKAAYETPNYYGKKD